MKLAVHTTEADDAAIAKIQGRIIGWSDHRQYYFFKAILAANPDLHYLLMIGVYYGRDIAFIQAVLELHHPERVLHIVGVDRFSSARCADWPHDAVSWEKLTGGMPAPDMVKASMNVQASKFGRVVLVKEDDAEFLRDDLAKFDLVYLDAAHDFASVARQLRQVRRVCSGQRTIICGDDYSNLNGWGVRRAVEAGFGNHWVFQGWIWYSNLALLNP